LRWSHFFLQSSDSKDVPAEEETYEGTCFHQLLVQHRAMPTIYEVLVMEDHWTQEQADRYYFCSLDCAESIEKAFDHEPATAQYPEAISSSALPPTQDTELCWKCNAPLG
jgi:hypothetical protein